MFVKGIGPLDAQIAFVGEFPGSEEDRTGIPFMGNGGKLLNELMHSAGIMRDSVYLTNIIKERPHGGVANIISFGKYGSAVESVAYKEWVLMLKEELDACSANVIVPLGNIPLYALTGQTAITLRAGSVMESTLLPGRKIVPTIHPASALRAYLWRYDIMHDLIRIKQESKTPECVYPDNTIHIEPSFIEVMSFLERVLQEPITDLDIEISGMEVSCISFTIGHNEGMSIPFLHKGDYFPPDQETEIWLKIAEILEHPTQSHIGHNMAFDAWFLFLRYGIRITNIEDSMVAQAIVNPDFPKSLAYVTRIYTKEPYYKDEGKKSGGFSGGGSRGFWLYNAKDSLTSHQAYIQLMADITTTGNVATYQRQVGVIPMIIYLQTRGCKVDVAGLRAESVIVKKEEDKLTAELQELAGYRINPNSPKQLLSLFYVQLGYPPYFKNKKPTTDVDALKRLARKGSKEAQILMKHRKVAKKRGTYLEMTFDEDDRMRASFNPVGTRTGRWSSSQNLFKTGGNFQNLPHSIRKYFMADEGYVMYEVDLSQAENRIVAVCAQEARMIQAFATGEDVHSLTAGLVFNKVPESISRKDGSSSLGTGEQSERFWGKKCNHSLNYAFGYKAFAMKFEISEMEAKRIVERYHTIYPNIRNKYHKMVQDSLSKDRSVTNLLGRKQIFRERWGPELFKDAYAFIPQSTVADIVDDALIEIWNDQDTFGLVEPLMQGHDSFLFQMPLNAPFDEHKRVLRAIKSSLTHELTWLGQTFTIPVDFQMGLNFGPGTKPEYDVDDNPSGLIEIDIEDLESAYAKITRLD
jgi:uracil-DNA glycosylase family 4